MINCCYYAIIINRDVRKDETMSIFKHKYINKTKKVKVPKKRTKTKPINKKMHIGNKDIDNIISKRYLFISIIIFILFLVIGIRLFNL